MGSALLHRRMGGCEIPRTDPSVAPLAPNIPFVTIAFRDHRRGRMPLFACRCRQMSSMSLWDVAKEQMEFVIITARVQTQRIMTVLVEIGTRLPAHATSMGRVCWLT